MIWRHGILLTLCLTLSALAAFYFSAGLEVTPTSWSYTDLRLLDAADAMQPTHDLVAVYTRRAADTLQIRLDMLEHAATPDYDLYLALDSLPGGSRSLPVNAQADLDWDVLLVIPASGAMQALDRQMQPVSAAGLRVVRDPVLDQVVISLNGSALLLRQSTFPDRPQAYHSDPSLNLQVFLTIPNGDRVADRSGPSRPGKSPPPPARVLLAFWNTYPAYTPATALRRWNGAHTGPLGGSHGLLHLLRAARVEGAPLALLDLKYPAWLSALEFTGGIELVRQLSQQDLLILPEYLPNLGTIEGNQTQWVEAAAGRLEQAGEGFGLSPSSFRFTQPEYFPASAGFYLLFADLTQHAGEPSPLAPISLTRWQGQRVLVIQRYSDQQVQAQVDGPSLEVRRALGQAALSASQPGGEAIILALGGDLPGSTWGAATAASATLHYLKSRPWIHLLTEQDLLSAPATEQRLELERNVATIPAALHDDWGLQAALGQAPANALGVAAWQAYLALTAPVYPAAAGLPALRANYRGQVWSLLAAASWAEHPATRAGCGTDPDRDGRPDCILSTEEFYAQFEIESGALTYFFQRDPTAAVHQIIGPSSQIISGLSDPQSWALTGGLTADPAVIPGAFAQAGMNYQATLTGKRLTFTTSDRSSQKTYEYHADGLRFSFKAEQPETLRLPLLLDPWVRLTPGWSARYRHSQVLSGWTAALDGGAAGPVQVEIRSNTALTLQAFSEAAPFTHRAENPNLDYPPGTFLPFPLAEVSLGAAPGEDTIVDIVFIH